MATFRALSLATLASILPALVQGISFTSPASSDVITKGSQITAKWTSVDTDPTVFSIYAWNFVQWPPYYEALAYDVDTTVGEATVRIPCHVANGEGWQLTALNNTNVYVLYAQSDKFNVTGDACADPTTSASCYAPTSTVYVTQTAGTPVATPTSGSLVKAGVANAVSTNKPEVIDIDIDLALNANIEI